MGNVGFALELELGLLIEHQQGFEELMSPCLEGALWQSPLDAWQRFPRRVQTADKRRTGRPADWCHRVMGAPEFLNLALIPPRLDLSLFGDEGQFYRRPCTGVGRLLDR